MKKTIKDIDIKNKKVILRCDFNVPVENGKILDDNRIAAALPTINYLIENNCRIIILSHFGKVKSVSDLSKNSLRCVADKLSLLLKRTVIFPGVTRSVDLFDQVDGMNEKDVMLLENTRFEDASNNLESGCDDDLAKYWASLGDIFVNDAFGTIHREHASNYGITRYLPSVVGFLVEKEMLKLNELIENPYHPFIVIMGGAKLEDKIPLIESVLSKCDKLLLTGGLANTFLKALGFNIGMSLYDPKTIDLVKKLLLENKDKILLPIDLAVGNMYDPNFARGCLVNEVKDDEVIYDIGLKTIKKFAGEIYTAETIFVNGTMGKYEDKKFLNGTRETFRELAKCPAKVFVGGGDAGAAVKFFKFDEEMYYISTGGGATLEYIRDPKLKSLENIEDK